MEGALVAGMFHVMPRPYPVEVFEDLEPALAWLAAQDRSLADLQQSLPGEIEQLFRARTETAPIVSVLRGYLDRNLTGANVGDAARALSVSLRTLQRRLAEAETTFHEELAKARLAAAQRLMLDSDAPLTTIALEVGCPSLQYFSALFRRQTGQSPSAWRSSRRASSAEGGGR
jgi:AraC-like DNA-binding protein